MKVVQHCKYFKPLKCLPWKGDFYDELYLDFFFNWDKTISLSRPVGLPWSPLLYFDDIVKKTE